MQTQVCPGQSNITTCVPLKCHLSAQSCTGCERAVLTSEDLEQQGEGPSGRGWRWRWESAHLHAKLQVSTSKEAALKNHPGKQTPPAKKAFTTPSGQQEIAGDTQQTDRVLCRRTSQGITLVNTVFTLAINHIPTTSGDVKKIL